LRGKLVGMTNIKDRPEEIERRLVPGHWEVDLVLGARGASAIGTLVERTPASTFWSTCRRARPMWWPARSRARSTRSPSPCARP
jgi:IS30 family transposase